MDLRDFLQAVVPDGGVIVLARLVAREADGRRYNTFAHSCVKSHERATELVGELAASQENVYFALASFRQGFHKNAQDKTVVRVRENVHRLKALWFDIDFKHEYPDAKTAVLALRAFSQTTGMPAPSILVGSGNGLHAYWPLTQALTPERWTPLAEALKEAAKTVGLAADLACTADACRVLRPPGTANWKDPANPKPVRILHSSDKVFDPEALDAILLPYRQARSAPVGKPSAKLLPVNDELTGGLGHREKAEARFDEIVKHCAVARHAMETHGSDASEPEWTAMLQLLRHCDDGALWVHPLSDGHAGYSSGSTERKWQYRLQNTAGPTLCSTLAGYRPQLCGKCPHKGFIKTPLQVGVEGTQAVEDFPSGWRVAENKKGVERLMVLDAGDGKTSREWVRVLRYVPQNLRVTRSIVTGHYNLQLDVELQNSKPWHVTIPGGHLGNPRKLTEQLAESGLVLKEKEGKQFLELMASWLAGIQAARRVADVTEQMGWLIEGEKTVGFSCGPTTFYTDGRTRNDVRAAREFAPIAKHYEPRGGLEPWKKVAKFLADQNNPAFTAVLASGFGAPLLKFTGLSGGILSLVSSASGVGKSSALKCSQAIWGSPTHGVNAVDDTPKSVARKLGFLSHLPAFWDELRGRKTVEDFLTLAFQITQGKEKSRLDSAANLRESASWETMLIVASNESIFEAMARGAGGSDAGVVRCFEILVEPFVSTRNRAEISLLFEQLNGNFGHAGRIYAEYLATHVDEVRTAVENMFTKLATAGHMQAQERFWFAIMAALLVGAQLAAQLDLVKIDVRALASFLMQNLHRLRGRSGEAMSLTDPFEVLAAFMQTYQDRALIVDKFPAPRANTSGYLPDITGGAPRGERIMYHVARDERLVRIPILEFQRFLDQRSLPVYTIVKRMMNDMQARRVRCRLGIGTKWELPPQRCFQFSLDVIAGAADLISPEEGSSSSERSPDSGAPTAP